MVGWGLWVLVKGKTWVCGAPGSWIPLSSVECCTVGHPECCGWRCDPGLNASASFARDLFVWQCVQCFSDPGMDLQCLCVGLDGGPTLQSDIPAPEMWTRVTWADEIALIHHHHMCITTHPPHVPPKVPPQRNIYVFSKIFGLIAGLDCLKKFAEEGLVFCNLCCDIYSSIVTNCILLLQFCLLHCI